MDTNSTAPRKPTREELLARAERIRFLAVPAPVSPRARALEAMLASVRKIEAETRPERAEAGS